MADIKRSYSSDNLVDLIDQITADSTQVDSGKTAGILTHNLGSGIKNRKINILTEGTVKNTQQAQYTQGLIEAAPELQQVLADYEASLPPGYTVSYEYIPRTNEFHVYTKFDGKAIGNKPITVIMEDLQGRTGGSATKGAQVMVVDRNKQGQTMMTQAGVAGMQKLAKALNDKGSNIAKYANAARNLNAADPVQAKAQKALLAKLNNSISYYMKEANKAARPGETMVGSAAHTYKTPNPQTALQNEQTIAYGAIVDQFFNSPTVRKILKEAGSSAREAKNRMKLNLQVGADIDRGVAAELKKHPGFKQLQADLEMLQRSGVSHQLGNDESFGRGTIVGTPVSGPHKYSSGRSTVQAGNYGVLSAAAKQARAARGRVAAGGRPEDGKYLILTTGTNKARSAGFISATPEGGAYITNQVAEEMGRTMTVQEKLSVDEIRKKQAKAKLRLTKAGNKATRYAVEKPRDFDPFGQTGWSPLATI